MTGAQSPASLLRARTMLILACLLAAITAASALPAPAPAPATYDQRQDGDFNVRADVQNVVLLLAYPQKMSLPSGLFDGLKSAKRNHESDLQERADYNVMEAFVEPSTPYHVEIGDPSGRYVDGGSSGVEVVIAGRRRLESEAVAEPEVRDELKLIGATEQCGPEYERDPETLTCRLRAPDTASAAPAPAPAHTDPAPPTEMNLQSLTDQKSPEVIPVSS